jgi:hypothetical protein
MLFSRLLQAISQFQLCLDIRRICCRQFQKRGRVANPPPAASSFFFLSAFVLMLLFDFTMQPNQWLIIHNYRLYHI